MYWKKETQAVPFDRFDEGLWQDVLFDINSLRKGRDEIWERHDFVGEAYQDFFMQLFQGDPMMWERKDMQEDHIFNHGIVDKFKDWQEVAELRVSTIMDEYAAAFSMITLQPEIKKLYEENQKIMEMMKALKELLEKLAEQQGQGDMNAMALTQSEIDALAKAAGDLMDGISVDFKGAVKKASEELAKEDSMMRSFGLEEGQLQRMDFKERRALADTLKNGRMMQFAQLIGQFKLVARGAKRSKTATIPDEVAGLEFGDDISNLAVESLINLTTPELEMKFWKDYASKELVQKKVVGPHSLGKGPIIVVCDESGSMGAACHGGTREMWSKALSLALCDQARRNKRDFYYIGFSGDTKFYEVMFPNGRIDYKKLIEFSEHFFCGGTYPYAALMRAARIVDSYKVHRPDIVFITDGEFGEPIAKNERYAGYGFDEGNFWEDWNDIKKRTEMQAFGIAFDCNPREMKKLVDTVVNLEDMTASPDKMKSIFAKVDRT